jgi:hypothetical protein
VDLAQVFISVAEWVFFGVWALALLALSVVAFGRDFFSTTEKGKSATYILLKQTVRRRA